MAELYTPEITIQPKVRMVMSMRSASKQAAQPVEFTWHAAENDISYCYVAANFFMKFSNGFYLTRKIEKDPIQIMIVSVFITEDSEPLTFVFEKMDLESRGSYVLASYDLTEDEEDYLVENCLINFNDNINVTEQDMKDKFLGDYYELITNHFWHLEHRN